MTWPAGAALAGLALLGLLATVGPAAGQTGPAPERADETPFPLEAHRTNYLLPLTWDFKERGDGREQEELKFQFSLKKHIGGSLPLYLAYTQRSFWQAYDKRDSRPFRDNTYNPELFLDYGDASLWGWPLGWRAGFEHESNGRPEPDSRGWTGVYLQPVYRWEAWSAAVKVWARRPEFNSPETEPDGDANGQILQYLGYFEASLAAHLAERHELEALMRKGTRDDTGTYQVDYSYAAAFLTPGVSFHVQFFHGYGESLIDYNRRITKVGVGFAFR